MKFSLLLLSLLAGMFLHAQNLSVIGNPTAVPTAMTMAKLKSVFVGETKNWDNSTKVVLALMKSNTEPGKHTCEKIYQRSCDEVTKFWLGKAMENNTTAPVFFNTVSELQAFVAGKPGAIGIIDLSPAAAGVRVIMVDGKRAF